MSVDLNLKQKIDNVLTAENISNFSHFFFIIIYFERFQLVASYNDL